VRTSEIRGDLGREGGFTGQDVALCRSWAGHFQTRGLQCLPSRPDRKQPFTRYADWWDGGGPSVESLWSKYPSGNVQVMTGRAYNLCVLDLDGQEGVDAFHGWLADRGGRLPKCWISSSGGGGRHLWFSLPTVARKGPPLPRRRLWGEWDPEARDGSGAWAKHRGVEFLGDHCLIMAPPSIHPETGKRYKFHRGHSPGEIAYPSPIPLWVLTWPTMTAPVQPRPQMPERPARRLECPTSHGRPPRLVLDAIPDKIALVASWGVRIASRKVNPAGWLQCHDLDRPDKNPSAMFNPSTGRFWRPGERSMCLFRLGVETGQYATWRDALNDLARIYLPR
jgi:hypothetical protein